MAGSVMRTSVWKPDAPSVEAACSCSIPISRSTGTTSRTTNGSETKMVATIFALPGLVLATIFVALPFVVPEVVPVLREIGIEQEQAAATLGASGFATFRRVTLPAIRWAVAYGVVLTSARCLGEFGAVSVVSGHLAGKTETATLFVQDSFESFDLTGAYAGSVVLAAIAIATLVAMNVFRPKEETR